MTTETATPAPIVSPSPTRERITTSVEKEIQKFISEGRLTLPSNYAIGNALSAAWLYLQTVQNRDGKNIIVNGQIDTSVVTEKSVANALRKYAIQGLNVDKFQAYFIVYGKELTMQRSYFGDQVLAARVKPGISVYSALIHEGDDVEVEISQGKTTIAKHVTKFGNADKPIKGGYCGVIDENGVDLGVELMTMDQIIQSWKMSKTYKPDGNGTHQKFPREMAKRTLIRKRCTPIFNTSTDSCLLESLVPDHIEAEFAEELAIEANAGEEIVIQENETQDQQQEQQSRIVDPPAPTQQEAAAEAGF